jgi:hypothetical protein
VARSPSSQSAPPSSKTPNTAWSEFADSIAAFTSFTSWAGGIARSHDKLEGHPLKLYRRSINLWNRRRFETASGHG